jgi:serine/threonine protein kinase
MLDRLRFLGRRDDRPRVAGLPSRYVVERELGRGGTAVVYLARDVQLKREVAIKVLRSTLQQDRSSVARLWHEARFVAQLQHPNIVAIHDIERLSERSVALVMQYVRGRTLREAIDRDGPLSIAAAERVLIEVARALGAAHRRGIIHRDVKPENVYLEEDDGRALLADFGIARAPELEPGLTVAGEALGTPHYMSPEQVSGVDLDGRSDLYGLGLLGYEMLTGERPWSGETLYRVLHKQQHEMLPAIRHRRPNLPEPLERAIECTLQKEPWNRPDTAERFIALVTESSPAEDCEVSMPRSTPATGDATSGLDAPTIRYRRSAVEGAQSPAAAQSDGPTPTELPSALSPAEGATPLEPGSAEVPSTEAGASDRPGRIGPDPGIEETIHLPDAPAATPALPTPDPENDQIPEIEPGLGLDWSGANREKRRRKGFVTSTSGPLGTRRGKFAIVAASLLTATTIVLVGLLTSPAGSAAGTTAEPDDPIATSDGIGLGVPAASRATSRPPPVPTNASARSSGARPSGAAENAGWRYQAAGDLTDIFCQPLEDESRMDWRRRVPGYCAGRDQ